MKQPLTLAAKFIKWYFSLACMMLLMASIAKIISATGSAKILQNGDPLFLISYRQLFWLTGILELIVAMCCCFSKDIVIKAGLLAWISTGFVMYRLGLLWIGHKARCPCLGGLTDALGITEKTSDFMLKGILLYLLTGSFLLLFLEIWSRQPLKAAKANAWILHAN